MKTRILYLEDCSVDIQIVTDALQDSDLSFQLTVVGNGADFIEAVFNKSPDVVLLDYRNPGYDSIAALQEIRKRDSILPVILISGIIGEEIAVEALKKGATDYVIKQNLSRLAPSIKLALKEYDIQKEQIKAQQSLKAYSQTLAAANQELSQKNRELEEANRKLRHLDEMKSSFISMAAHELRTKVTSVMAFADTLLSGDIRLSEKDRRKFIGIISQESRRLKSLLNTLLDLSRIDRGTLRLTTQRFDLREELDSVLISLQVPSAVTVRISGAQPCPVRADRERLHQVLNNILENALRYTEPAGEISITVERGEKQILVQIKDTGPGIMPQELERIFDLFYRSTFATKESRGSGLGLSIAKEIVQLHGGRIWVESSPGQGALFSFTLPVT